MSIKLVTRKQTGKLTLEVRARAPSGEIIRVQRRPSSERRALAKKEAERIEADIIEGKYDDSCAVHTFGDAVKAYLETGGPHSAATGARFNRLLRAVGDVELSQINQDTVTRLKKTMLMQHRAKVMTAAAVRRGKPIPEIPEPSPGTVTREIIGPLRAAMRIAQERGWCLAPKFRVPKETEGRTLFLQPNEAERLIVAASPHVVPLFDVLIGCGARLAEALYLEWQDVDLVAGRVIFWADRTKGGKRRNAFLSPRAVAALANLPHRDGMVFRRSDGQPYADRDGAGGQIKKAFAGAIKRAGLNSELTPHCLRHTWASWHYALHKDPIRLKMEGGWSDLKLVERYAHLMPEGRQAEIERFLGLSLLASKVA